MSIPVLVLRPEPGNSSTTRNVQALGLEAISFPLFEASTVPWQCPDTSEFDGVLITSLHSRAGTRTYLKNIKKGESELELSKEEKSVLSEALEN